MRRRRARKRLLLARGLPSRCVRPRCQQGAPVSPSSTRPDLDEFVAAFKPGERHKREEGERFKRWTFEQIAERPGFNLDIWADVKDDSLDDPADLPAPEVIAERIIATVTEALEQFAAVAAELGEVESADAAPET